MRDKGSFPFNLKCRKFRLVHQMERTISVCRPEYSGPALKVVHFDRSGHFGRSDRHDKIVVSLFQAFRQQSAAVSGGARVGLIKNPVEHSSHVGLCMAMYGYVGLCIAMQGYVGLFLAVYSFVGLCRAVYGYVGLSSFVFFVREFFSRALLSERLEQAKLLSPIPFFFIPLARTDYNETRCGLGSIQHVEFSKFQTGIFEWKARGLSTVVYHLHGQTGRFTIWVNGSQSSGLLNFVPEQRLHWPFTGKRPRRPETGIKDGFEETEHEFPFGIFHLEKLDYLFRCSVASGNFPFQILKSGFRISNRTRNMKTDYNAEISGIGFHFYRSIGKSKKGFEKLSLRWPEPIYMRVGYVFESRFSAGMINRFL